MLYNIDTILGIDPSIRNTGIAIIDIRYNNNISILNTQTIKTQNKNSLGQRLLEIEYKLTNILNQYQPSAVAIEHPFIFKAFQGIIALGAAYGTCLKVCAQNNIAVRELQPSFVKTTIHGNGHATKHQMKCAVTSFFNNENDLSLKTEDEIDAIAISLTLQKILEQQNNRLI